MTILLHVMKVKSLAPTPFLCKTVGGIHNILSKIPAWALSIAGGNRTAFFDDKMYDFESFVR